MDLTISSIITMCLLNSILIMALCLIYKIDFIMKKIGPSCMIIILLAIIIRMFVPFEFPYTYSWYIEDILSPFRDILIYPIITNPIEITVWHILIGLWVLGIIFNLVRKLFTYRRFMRCIELLPKEQWETVCEKFSFDAARYPYIKNITLVYCKQFRSPYLVGLKKSYLVLPDDHYVNEELHYIVLHELMHVRNKDIMWKVLIDILCVAFWWNPVIYYLRKELFQLIEMRNDAQILSTLSDEEKISYIKCLKSTAVDLAGKDMSFGVSFNRNDLKELERRMKLIVNDNKFSRMQQTILSIIVCLLLVCTSMIIIEPYSFDEIELEGIVLTESNTYLIINGDEYDIYVNDQYVMTTDDLQHFEGVNIYNSIEEAQEYE